jgi:hypothetical protein
MWFAFYFHPVMKVWGSTASEKVTPLGKIKSQSFLYQGFAFFKNGLDFAVSVLLVSA